MAEQHAFNQIIADMRKGDVPNVLLLFGVEQYLVSWAADTLVQNYVNEATKAFDFQTFDPVNLDLDEVMMACDTLPMFSERRVVLIEGFTQLFGKNLKEIAGSIDEFTEYIPKVPDTTLLILTAGTKPGRGDDGNTKLFDAIVKNARPYEFTLLSQPDLKKFILKRIQAAGKDVSPADLDFLIRSSAYSDKDADYALFNLDNDIKKIIALCAGTTITGQEISLGITDSLETNVFKMLDGICDNNKERAFIILNDIIKNSSNLAATIQGMLSSIIGQLEMLIMIKECMQEGLGQQETANILKYNGFRVKMGWRHASNMSFERLLKGLKEACETDSKIKTGVLEPQIALELLVALI